MNFFLIRLPVYYYFGKTANKAKALTDEIKQIYTLTTRPGKLAADTFRIISRIFLMTFLPKQWLTCVKYRHLECTMKVNDKYSSKNGVSPILGYCLIIIKFCSNRGYPGFPDILGLFFISQHFGFHIFLLPIYT